MLPSRRNYCPRRRLFPTVRSIQQTPDMALEKTTWHPECPTIFGNSLPPLFLDRSGRCSAAREDIQYCRTEEHSMATQEWQKWLVRSAPMKESSLTCLLMRGAAGLVESMHVHRLNLSEARCFPGTMLPRQQHTHSTLPAPVHHKPHQISALLLLCRMA